MTEKRFDYVQGVDYLQGIGIHKIFETGKKNYDLGYAEDVKEVVELLNNLYEENGQLRKDNEKLKKCLQKTQEDLDFFANLKVIAMQGSEPK